MTEMNDNLTKAMKIKYCESRLEHLLEEDKKKVLYKVYDSYYQNKPSDIDRDKLTKFNEELNQVFSQNAVGTMLDLDKLNMSGLDILYNFIKLELSEN